MLNSNLIPDEDHIPDWSNPWIYSDVNIIRNLNMDSLPKPPQLPLKRSKDEESIMQKRGLWNMFRLFEDGQKEVMMKRNFVPMLG